MNKWLILILLLTSCVSLWAQEEPHPPLLEIGDYREPPMEMDPLLDNWFASADTRKGRYISGGVTIAALGSLTASCWYTLDAAARDPYSDEVQKGLLMTGGSVVFSGLSAILFDFFLNAEE